MSICTACWKGSYSGGVCDSCGHAEVPADARRPDALPLMTLVNNRYFVGDVLGKGGFGITYSAWDNQEKRRVALKELYPSVSVTRNSGETCVTVITGTGDYFAGMKEKFAEEAKLLRKIDEDCHVVKVYDLFRANNTVYYAMEFLEGCDLNAYRKAHGLLSWDFLEPIMRSILQTLDILHRKNLIHRDISPDNIFLLSDNSVRLIDFGSARAYQGVTHLTVEKKPGFSPWEQLESNGKQGPWTDIYSLSVTMYLLLSGKLPPDAAKRITGEADVIPLKQLCPDVPDQVVKAIEKGMSVAIRDRFQSSQAYMRALGFTSDSKPPAPPTPPIPPTPPTPPPAKPTPPRNCVYWISGRSGVYMGRRKRLAVGKETTFGRFSTNDVTFPEYTNGVSRYQCSVLVTDDHRIRVKDCGSTFGSFLDNVRLSRDWMEAKPGSILRFGNEAFELVCKEQ